MAKITAEDVVLFVDDDENVLKSIKRGLTDEPYSILLANSGEKALELLAHNTVAVMVTDLKMPGMSGIDLMEIVSEKYPSVVKIVLTAYYQVSTILSAIRSGHVFQYLTKPWKFDEEFIPVINNAIERHKLMTSNIAINRQLLVQKQQLEKQNIELEKLKNACTAMSTFRSDTVGATLKTLQEFTANLNQLKKEVDGLSAADIKDRLGELVEQTEVIAKRMRSAQNDG